MQLTGTYPWGEGAAVERVERCVGRGGRFQLVAVVVVGLLLLVENCPRVSGIVFWCGSGRGRGEGGSGVRQSGCLVLGGMVYVLGGVACWPGR